MKKPDDVSRIADNPTVKGLSSLLPLLTTVRTFVGIAAKFGVTDVRLNRVHNDVAEMIEQSKILTLPDRFNDAFANRGWIATGSLSTAVMEEALELNQAGEVDEAEGRIASWLTEETIDLFAIARAKRFNAAEDRWFQLREALALTLEERYWSAIPLILIAADGFASDVLGKSPFEKDADLSIFDSIAGHSTSLPFLMGKLTKGVRKSSDQQISLPLRHGILHGRSLGYANRLVCMKAWFLMIALVDWAYDKSSENERKSKRQREEVNWTDVWQSLKKSDETRKAIAAFVSWEKEGPFDDIHKDSPEFAVVDFLSAWQRKNYGQMAERVVNLAGVPIRKMAGRMRNDTEFVTLQSFELLSIRQGVLARADARVRLKGKTLNGEVEGIFNVIVFRNTLDGDIAMPTDNARWFVSNKCIYDLMHRNTVA